jgi:hypothetical protein
VLGGCALRACAVARRSCSFFRPALPGETRHVGGGGHEGDDGGRDGCDWNEDGEEPFRRESAARAGRRPSSGQVEEDRLAPARGELEELRLAKRIATGEHAGDVFGALRTRGEMHLERGTVVGRQIALDVVEEIDVLWVRSGHHLFDYMSSFLVPSNSPSRLRPRKIRDFTVPSATPVSSAISPYEQPRTS